LRRSRATSTRRRPPNRRCDAQVRALTRIHLCMESAHTSEEQTDLVRCLDCKTVYRRPLADEDADPCPTCGYVGWIVLNPGQKRAKAES